jgi:hypothetical protein
LPRQASTTVDALFRRSRECAVPAIKVALNLSALQSDCALGAKAVAKENDSVHADAIRAQSVFGRIGEFAVRTNKSTDFRAEQSHFTLEALSKENATIHADQIRVQRHLRSIAEDAVVASKIAPNLPAEQSHFAIGLKPVTKENSTSHADTIGVERHSRRIHEYALPAIKSGADFRAEQSHFTFRSEAVAKENIALYANAISV